MKIRERILIIHPVLAPYRVDFFNQLNEFYDIKLLLLKGNFTDNPFNQHDLQNSLTCEIKVLKESAQS